MRLFFNKVNFSNGFQPLICGIITKQMCIWCVLQAWYLQKSVF